MEENTITKLFGTDGIRGIINEGLDADLVSKLGNVAGNLLCDEQSVVVIGRDTRESGQDLEDAISEGFINQGVRVLKAGVIPTPAVSYLSKQFNATLGVVISASHNPCEHNGIKFFDQNGLKLEDQYENLIEKNIDSANVLNGRHKGSSSIISGNELYIDHLKKCVDVSLEGMNVVMDCANGAASFVGPQLFSELGLNMKMHSCHPNGSNINLECGSTNPHKLQKLIKDSKFDVGFAFDGDADRAVAVDENGDLVDGDFIIAICAKEMIESNRLPGNKIVTTVMTNMGFHLAMKELGIDVLLTDVGDKYVLEKMIENNIVLGGEQSGHIIFLDHGPTGDGLLTSLMLMQVMQKTNKPLSELRKIMRRLPQVLLNVVVKNKLGWEENKKITDAITYAEADLGERGRILVRPSGTEQLIRVMTEGDTLDHSKKVAENVARVVEEEFS